MIAVHSNIDQILAKFDRAERDIPRDIQMVFHPQLWRDLAVQVALRVLTDLATPDQQPYVRGFVRTITVDQQGKGMRWRMVEPEELDEDTETRVNQIIQQFVEQEKNIVPERDRSVEQTTARVAAIVRNAKTGPGNEGASSLAEAVNRFAEDSQGAVPSDVAHWWLTAVLEAWTAIVLETLPEKVLNQITLGFR